MRNAIRALMIGCFAVAPVLSAHAQTTDTPPAATTDTADVSTTDEAKPADAAQPVVGEAVPTDPASVPAETAATAATVEPAPTEKPAEASATVVPPVAESPTTAGATVADAEPSTTVGTTIAEPARPATDASIERGIWYLGLGAGFGGANLAEEAIGGGTALLLNVRVGAILFDWILVGGEAVFLNQYNEWAESTPTGAFSSSFLGQGMVFPLRDLPLNVAAGLGYASALKVRRLADKGKDSVSVAASSDNGGVAWMTGVGWDFFAGDGLNLGLQARYDGAHYSNFGTTHAGSLAVWLNFY